MPAAADGPQGVARIARRYRRVTLAVSGAVAAVVVGVVLAVYARTGGLVPTAAVGVAVALALRVPVFRTSGRTTLRTDADPDTVRADFDGATPPPLAFQWGLADAVEPTASGAVYDLSYLLGLRSVRMETAVRTPTDGTDADLELAVTAAGRPWGTYRVSITEREEATVVDVAVDSDRRFGLRRLPQWLIARRYRPAALAEQGYTVVDVDAWLSVQGS